MSYKNILDSSILQVNRNCWRINRSSHASIVIDCGNYYRDIYESICKAQHSIFILGWDIDGRIELLRGKQQHYTSCPTQLFGLLQWKARQNPDIMIYLNRWDYSIYQAAEREAFSEFRWRFYSPPNIHYCLDNIIPAGGCHHQKIIVIDDEIAFSGGMDIALQRWDLREHYPENADRTDPSGPYTFGKPIAYYPFHDIQMLVAGDAARSLAELARERWRLGAGFNPIPVRKIQTDGLPHSWPDSETPDFENIITGISLTMPSIYDRPSLEQVEQLYLDQIACAEKFIYMENQFFTCENIAYALNKRLCDNPALRVLLVSCKQPKGIMEKKAMWTGRVRFNDILTSGGVADRVVLTSPASRVDGFETPIRVHSKVTIIDDRLLRVGSSNINRRSMKLDTECDLLFEAQQDKERQKIAQIRNNLIREHTGQEMDTIDKFIHNGDCIEKFLTYISTSRQHLQKVNDGIYRYERFAKLATRIADPHKPFVPGEWTMPYRYPGIDRNLRRRMLFSVIFLLMITCIILIWKWTPLAEYASADRIESFMQHISDSPWAFITVLVIFVVGGLIFFPVLVLITATAAAFGPFTGFILAMAGTLLSASTGFFIGRMLSMNVLRVLIGSSAEKIKQYAHKAGVTGIVALRMMPIAPFSVINLGLGITQMSFPVYLIGTFLGLFPGIIIFAFLGDSFMQLLQNQDERSLLYLGCGMLAWLALIVSSHMLSRRWYMKTHGRKTE